MVTIEQSYDVSSKKKRVGTISKKKEQIPNMVNI